MRTPKTLKEAIENGLCDASLKGYDQIAEFIESHVRDFLAQKFGAHELNFSGQETAALWKMITGKEYVK